MDDDAIGRWLDRAHAAYVADLISSGVGEQAAARIASEQEAAAFPDGRPASGHTVFDIAVDGEVVGHLWIGPRDADDEAHWWIWDIEIDEAWRGRGIGSEAMHFAEQHAKDRGGVEIGLTVMADNRARRLYASLGYTEASLRMRKSLQS